jgi:hypothetical protein
VAKSSDTALSNWKTLDLLVELPMKAKKEPSNTLARLLPRREQLTWTELLHKLSRKERRNTKRNDLANDLQYWHLTPFITEFSHTYFLLQVSILLFFILIPLLLLRFYKFSHYPNLLIAVNNFNDYI